MKKIELREILFLSVKILIVLVSIILIIFLTKYFYQILNSIFEIRALVSENKIIHFEVEKLERFLPRLGLEIGE